MFLFHCAADHPDLHSFPTRRSSDLAMAEFIAGGTDMVQLLQEHVRRPDRLVSLAGLLDSRIQDVPEGLRIGAAVTMAEAAAHRSEEHTSELQSRLHLVCRLLLEKKN